MKASKVFPGAESNLKALLARLVTSEDKLVAAFSQLLPKLIFPGKEENAFEVSQVSFNFESEVELISIFNVLFTKQSKALSGDIRRNPISFAQ